MYYHVIKTHQRILRLPKFLLFLDLIDIIMYPLAVREILKNLMNNPELNRTEWSNNKFLTKFFFMEVININHFNDFVSIENYIMFFESNAKFANKYTCNCNICNSLPLVYFHVTADFLVLFHYDYLFCIINKNSRLCTT